MDPSCIVVLERKGRLSLVSGLFDGLVPLEQTRVATKGSFYIWPRRLYGGYRRHSGIIATRSTSPDA